VVLLIAAGMIFWVESSVHGLGVLARYIVFASIYLIVPSVYLDGY
jgi:hypothetical protein